MKNTRYLLKSVTPCADCNGKGVVENPAWTAFSAWYKSYKDMYGYRPDPGISRAWWSDTAGHTEIPPEEYDCPTCHGAGQIETDVDLQTALANINYPVPNHNH